MALTTEQYLQALTRRVHEELIDWNGNPDVLLAKIIACHLHDVGTKAAIEEAIALVIGNDVAITKLAREVTR